MYQHAVLTMDVDSYVVRGFIAAHSFQCPPGPKSPPLTIEQARSVMECLENVGAESLSIEKVKVHRTEYFSNISEEYVDWIYSVIRKEDP